MKNIKSQCLKISVLAFSFFVVTSTTAVQASANVNSNYENIYTTTKALINKLEQKINPQAKTETKKQINAQTASTEQAKVEFNKYRQHYHYSTPNDGSNDVQTIWKDKSGLWHFYYLHGGMDGDDYVPTSWKHVTSSDLIHFKDQGDAIKTVPGKFDAVFTGSVITNEKGIYKNLPKSEKVVIAAVSTPTLDWTGQNNWLLYSTDGGYHFKLMKDEPISGIPQGSDGFLEDNRDPVLWYNSKTKKMELYLAQSRNGKSDHGVAQYVTDDGIHFKELAYVSFGANNTLFDNSTVIETPSVSRMRDKTTGKVKDIMFLGLQNFTDGLDYKMVNGESHVAVQGKINSKGVFIPDGAVQDPQNSKHYIVTSDAKINRTDYGPDYYGTANELNKDPLKNVVNETIQAGWIGNWLYTLDNVEDGKPFALPGVSSFRKVYLDNGVVKASLVKLANSEWKANKVIQKAKVTAKDGLTTMAKSQPIAQTYTFNLAGTKDADFSSQFTFKQKDGSQSLLIYRDGNKLMVNNWRTGGTFTDEIPEAYTFSFENELNAKKITKMNVRTDTKSLEIEFPETGQVFTIMRYTLDSQQDLNVQVSGNNSQVKIADSKNRK
ncbi:hypothetical protein R4B61_02710 [Fructilactobacillus vespulae]|uniref:hypothetical protein n=1 Tax=Fructilactobacillus vespulae TaxID=1249630 RepID=UPI0039B647DE